ncbi:MAG: hypothetical protein WCH62_06715 [Candidatus Omnitrophota bacterium]
MTFNTKHSIVLFYIVLLLFSPCLAIAQVQNVQASLDQFNKINIVKENVKKIKKAVTNETDIQQWFGKAAGYFILESPVTAEDKLEFDKLLHKHIPLELKPKYPFPTVNQKVLYYIIPWIFEHPVPCSSMKGECVTIENLVLFVTVDKKTAMVQEFASFKFHFEHKYEPKNNLIIKSQSQTN